MTRSLAALLFIVAAAAATPVAAAAAAQSTNQIEGVVVETGPRPTVQTSYPAPGASVPSGVMVLKIVFDRSMKPDAWAYAPVAGTDFPKCLAVPRLLGDQRTFVLLCTVAADHAFALEINPEPRFVTDHGRSPVPFTLQFSTTTARTDTIHDALRQAGLGDADDPIMTEHPAVQGVSQTAPPE